MTDCRSPGESRSARPTDAEEVLRPLVACGICMEIYVDPVALLDCLHLACGSCAKEWLKYSTTCPHCRETVRGISDSHSTAAVVEAYRAIAPNSDLCQARPPEEIASLRQKYQPGQVVTTQPDPDETDSDSDLELSESWSSAEGSPSSNWDTTRFHNSCPFCNPSNESGFVCPRPCPQELSGVGLKTVPLGHTICGECNRFLPLREDLFGSKCVVCTQTTCSEMGQTCRGHAFQRIQLSKLRDVEFRPWRGILLNNAFGDNDHERDVFKAYIERRSLNLQMMFREVLEYYGPSLPRATWHGRAFDASSSDAVKLDDTVCTRCAADLVEANLFEWWLSRRTEADLPDDVRSRPDCPYGIDCLTARNDSDHTKGYNHICRPTAHQEFGGSDEHWHTIPEGGDRYVAESSDLTNGIPAFRQSNILFRDKGNEPVFLCSSICSTRNGPATIPGKTTLWKDHTTAYYGLNGQEYEHDGVVRLLLDTRNMHWVRTSKGTIPTGCRPVVGGHINTDGMDQELYHCVVWWRGQRIPGYTSPQMGHAAITWDGSMWYFEDQYELLCWDQM